MVLMRSRRLRIHIAASRTHKWLALFIGAQVLLWFISGAFMSFVPIEEVRGEHLVDRGSAVAIPPGTKLADPANYLNGPTESVTWRMLRGRVVAEVKSGDAVRLFDAATGMPLPFVDAEAAKSIATAAWKSAAKPTGSVERITAESTEYRGALPAWRVSFDDPDSTRVFVAESTGQITAVRTGTWRLYDFLWGLHIMDWKSHENFNTPWMLAFSIGSVLFGIAGATLLVIRMRRPFRRRR
jgi:hypothetical protein